MNSNDKKVKEILNDTEIPDEVSPENMKKMLDEKAPARKRSRISVVGRITAAAAACAVIVGSTAGTMKLAELSKNKPGHLQSDDVIRVEDESKTNLTIEQAKAPYMSSAESYEQIYDMLKKANKNRSSTMVTGANFRKAAADGAVYDNAADDYVEEAGMETVEAEIPASQDVNNGVVYGGMGGEEPEEFIPVPVEEAPENEAPPETEEQEEEPVETEAPPETESEGDYSKTYNQEKDVLEADIVKTDGERIYYLYNIYNDSKGHMMPMMNIAAVDNGSFTETYQLDITQVETPEGDGWETDIQVNDMYLYDDLIAVIGSVSSYRDSYTMYGDDYNGKNYFDEYEHSCFVSFYTIGSEPQHVGTYNQDGSYRDVRIAPDGYMYLMSDYDTLLFNEIDNADCIEDYIPKCGVGVRECVQPADILLPGDTLDNSAVLSYTVIGSIDLTASGEFSVCDTKALAGSIGNIYCSADNLYTAVGWEDTDITRISIGGGQIVPEASGKIEGYVRNQFSMSEYDGYLRVASTVDKWVDNGNFLTSMLDIAVESEHISDNRVYVMDMDMNIVGSVGGFGKNETIKSVSFSGNMGYVVTYEQTDPLFAIDFSDPASPFITDEFKILGYSTYMQQWDDGLLLGFGADADENGIETGVKLVMFDNSDPYDLKEVGLYAVNRNDDLSEYVYSSALWERKGLLIAPEKNLIGVPIALGRWADDGYGEESKYMFFAYENGEFIFRGEIAYETGFDKFGINTFDRAVYIGDYVYMLSGNRFVSADIETITQTDEVVFGVN